jgi:hypothetical protein
VDGSIVSKIILADPDMNQIPDIMFGTDRKVMSVRLLQGGGPSTGSSSGTGTTTPTQSGGSTTSTTTDPEFQNPFGSIDGIPAEWIPGILVICTIGIIKKTNKRK